MKLYLLRILFILTLPLQIVASDETGFEATEDEDASVPTHLVNCSQAIERVRQSVLDSAEGAENDLRSLSQCFSSGPQAHSATCRNRASEIQTMIQRTMDHQRDVHNYFRSRYPAFLNSLSTEERRIATNCFDHNTGSSDRATDERIRFNNNVGALQYSPTRDRFNISTTQCNRINERWGTFTAPERRAYEADDPIPNNEAYNRLQPFRESNIARLLGDNWVMRHQLSRSEVRELLYRSVANATNNIARFRGRASRWGVADYYKFYEFHQHFSEFLAAQPENLRQEYVRCREESNFFNACAENAAVAVANSVRLVVPAINTLLPC
ncbi:MAG: hypothetical protein HRT44_04145 [Bdellovibrionales bacterium]|nr:hypothetical protein [Bdellovibrionales bacterium]NQZ18434.1 hypothetical protein [Bdellovibrionales bacterium]